MKNKFKQQISYKMLLALVIILISSVLCAWIYVGHMHNLLVSETKTHLLEIAKQAKETVDSQLNKELEEVVTLGKILSGESQFDLAKSLAILDGYQKRAGENEFHRLGIITLDGSGYAANVSGTNFSDREYFQKAIKGQSNISKSLTDRITGIIDNTYATPVYDDQGKVVAVVAAARAVSMLQEVLDVNIFDGQGFLVIIDSESNIIASSECTNKKDDISNLNQVKFLDEKFDQTVFKDSGKSGITEVGVKGYENLYIAFTSLDVNGWYILSVAPISVVDSMVNQLVNSAVLLWVCLTALFVLVLVAFWVARNRYTQRLRKLAYVDHLTETGNWNTFLQKSHALLQGDKGDNYALVSCDIDDFKIINDVYGFANGNRTLKFIGHTLLKYTQTDECSARVFADNFAILMKYQTDQDIVDRIRQINNYIIEKTAPYKMVMSFGIYKIDDHSCDISLYTDKSQIARKTVKGLHIVNYAFYDVEMRSRILREKDLENAMDDALIQNQFKLYMQPKISFYTGQIIGGEVLTRWQHPDMGMIYPVEFIPLFEKNEFILKLDMHMFELACQYLQELQNSKGLGDFAYLNGFTISANFSPIHLHVPNFCDELWAITQKYQVSPRNLELELTESAIFSNLEALKRIATNLKQMGFLLTIDDFGSGYSSLNVLKDIPFDVVKFDKEFLRTSTEVERGRSILKYLVHMSKALHITSVAEGVETKLQAEFLEKIGCDVAQGFYYAKPMPLVDFAKFYAENKNFKS